MEQLERRLFARFIARFPTKFKDSAEDFGRDVYLRDVSATGARIATRDRLYIDDILSLSIKLPDGHSPVDLNGRVRWIHNHAPQVWEAGIQFHKVDLMKIHRIVKYSLETV
ncbi:MAG: PilZ domain-containing protein [Candidatus Omnitrophica bacterium]|nr:PilZ domain-containing protein [Candidatus Omnitrophota bacterium]